MDQEKRIMPKGGVFFYIKVDGAAYDKGMVDGMFKKEDEIRGLMMAGIIDNIVLENGDRNGN
jgi:hypothetical protein